MLYRKLAATRLFDGVRLLEDHVLIISEEGTVEAVVPRGEVPQNEIEALSGTLLPGMVNCHCHLELSHFKGAIPPHTGLVPFLVSVVQNRKGGEVEDRHLQAAERELWEGGVQAVADICNTADAVGVKKESPIRWHNLVEVLNFRDENTGPRLQHYGAVADGHRQSGLHAILTPHAPYSVSRATFAALNEATAGGLISIHNQESPAEDELFRTGGGPFLDLYRALGAPQSPLAVSGRSSLQTWLPYFDQGQTILSVHNTYTAEEDILFAQEYEARTGVRVVFCLCPNANLYIENTLPPVALFLKHHCRLVLGTDSYSSNWQLSVASEVATIVSHFPELPLETVLQWATSNGADVLGWKDLGRFVPGAKPGVVLLGEDFSVRRLA